MDKYNCARVRRNLAAYSDSQLESEDEAVIKEHLRNCPECLTLWNEQQTLNQLLDDLAIELPPDELTRHIMAAIKPLAEERKAAQTVELSWWDFVLRGFSLLVSTSLLALLCLIICLGLKFSWDEAPWLVWFKAAQWWQTSWSAIDSLAGKLTLFLYHIWDAAVNLPANSDISLSKAAISFWQHLLAYRSIIELILLAVIIWVLFAFIAAHLSSKIIFNYGEERN